MNLEKRRSRMVERQIAGRGIRNANVLRAMRTVPRHEFVDLAARGYAYDDCPLRIGCGQTISQPYMVALMTEMLNPQPDERILEIGTGSAYQTAILAELAAAVVSIERQKPLVARARDVLFGLQYVNALVLAGDGTLGYPDCAPYDGILVTAGGPRVPDSLKRQLAVGGRLVCPVGTRDAQTIVCIRRTSKGFQTERGTGCVFVPLIGAEGWRDTV